MGFNSGFKGLNQSATVSSLKGQFGMSLKILFPPPPRASFVYIPIFVNPFDTCFVTLLRLGAKVALDGKVGDASLVNLEFFSIQRKDIQQQNSVSLIV